MNTHIKLILSVMVVLGFVAGCATKTDLTLHPVSNIYPPLPEDIYELKKVERPPVLISALKVEYPKEFKKNHIAGQALVEFIVATDGSVADAVVIKATDARFATSALNAVSQLRFKPAKVGGKPVKCCLQQPIMFEIND